MKALFDARSVDADAKQHVKSSIDKVLDYAEKEKKIYFTW